MNNTVVGVPQSCHSRFTRLGHTLYMRTGSCYEGSRPGTTKTVCRAIRPYPSRAGAACMCISGLSTRDLVCLQTLSLLRSTSQRVRLAGLGFLSNRKHLQCESQCETQSRDGSLTLYCLQKQESDVRGLRYGFVPVGLGHIETQQEPSIRFTEKPPIRFSRSLPVSC